jgi:hypothetical protein
MLRNGGAFCAMAKRVSKVLVVLLMLAVPVYAADAPPLTLFSTVPQAQAHCPADTVVWLNLPTGIYHYRGQRWYARTNHGAFVCEREAVAAGDRASRNGQ